MNDMRMHRLTTRGEAEVRSRFAPSFGSSMPPLSSDAKEPCSLWRVLIQAVGTIVIPNTELKRSLGVTAISCSDE